MATERDPIVVDIETVPIENAEQYLDPVEADKRLTDPFKIERDLQEKAQARLGRLALDWNVARIAALGFYLPSRGPLVQLCRNELQEAEAIIAFWLLAAQRTIIGFNIKGFDLRFLVQRSRYLGITHPDIDFSKFNKRGVIDLFLELTFNEGHADYSRGEMRRTLKAFAKRFGIPCDDPINGKDIPALVAAGQWDDVEAHCASDLATTVALARQLGVLKPTGDDARGALERLRQLEDARP